MVYITRAQRKKRLKKKLIITAVVLVTIIIAVTAGVIYFRITSGQKKLNNSNAGFQLSSIPEYSGNPYVTVNGNLPYFEGTNLTTTAFENYSELDYLGRCGVAYANICKELLPTQERGTIGQIKPSGWHTVKYPEAIEDNYLYNRCHLIAYCLAGENDNDRNLITGTRYLNVSGMLPFEEKTVKYVEKTGNHVLYRVTPVFEGDNLVATGVLMEAYSVEDKGKGICFCVFCYNIQPGIEIDYRTGDSRLK